MVLFIEHDFLQCLLGAISIPNFKLPSYANLKVLPIDLSMGLKRFNNFLFTIFLSLKYKHVAI